MKNNALLSQTVMMTNRLRCLRCNVPYERFIFISMDDVEFKAALEPSSMSTPMIRTKKKAVINRVHIVRKIEKLTAVCPGCGKSRSIKMKTDKGWDIEALELEW